MQNFNIDSKGVNKLTEENMDAYLESLLQRERDKYKEDNIKFL
jgi:hypothetical protein